MLTKNLSKWKSIREIDAAYNNLEIRSVKLISQLMKNNFNIIRFEMAPLLDVDLSEEDDIRLEKYFSDLDNWCYRNYITTQTSKYNQVSSGSEFFSSASSTPKVGPGTMESPCSIMIQRRHSVKLHDLENL